MTKIRENQTDGQDEWWHQLTLDAQILKDDVGLRSFEAYRILLKTYTAKPVQKYVDDALSRGTF